MRPENIDLFVDRICGYFPTTNIARNTVKSAWRQEDVLIDLSEEDAKKVLSLIQVEITFPTLNRVKQIVRQMQRAGVREVSCHRCNGDGWDTGIVVVDGEPPTIRRWVYTEQWEGKTYSVVKKCQCRSEYRDYEQTAMDLPSL